MNHEWCKELPPKVREGHAAWLSWSRRTIVLRPVHFAEKSVRFMLIAPSSNQDAWTQGGLHRSSMQCYAIPDSQQVQTSPLLAVECIAMLLDRELTSGLPTLAAVYTLIVVLAEIRLCSGRTLARPSQSPATIPAPVASCQLRAQQHTIPCPSNL